MERLAVGLIGCGTLSSYAHGPALRKLERMYEFRAIADIDPTTLNAFSKRFGVDRKFTDYKEMISSEDLDIAIVATPTPTHEEIGLYVLNHGVNLFMEKPFALTLEGARNMIEASERQGRALQVGHCVRFWQGYVQIKEQMSNGDYGEPLLAKAHRWGTMPAPLWYRDPAQSNGVGLDVAIHDLDYLRWLIGEPKSVYAQGRFEGKLPMSVQAVLEFEGDAIAYIDASWDFPPSWRFATFFEIIGTKGMAQMDSRESTTLEVYTGHTSSASSPREDDAYTRQLAAFWEPARGGKPVLPATDSIKSLELALALNKSLNGAGRVELKREVVK
jgi:predicted dehydrogenase